VLDKIIEKVAEKKGEQTTFEFDTSWCLPAVVLEGGAPRLPPPHAPPQAIHGCHWLPEVAVKAFSINSLSEFQYILSIWPLANTLPK